MPGETTTRRAIRRILYDEIPYLGFSGTADSITSTTLVDTFAFQDTNLASDQFRGCYIYRPDRTGDDLIKKAGALTNSTGTLATSGATNYSNTSDYNYEIVGYLHPDELNECIKRAVRKVYFETQAPLTLVTDGDMSTSGVGSWTTVGTLGTKEKVTTAAHVFSGTQSLHTVNSATDSGVVCGTLAGNPLDPVFVSVTLKVASGTATVVVYDVTNSAVIDSVSVVNPGWVRVTLVENLPSTCYNWSVRLLGEENNAEVYWDHLVAYRRYDRRLMAPSWLNEQFKFLKLREARYSHTLDVGVDDANSRYFADWFQPQHFSLDPFHPEANAYAIQLQRPLPTADLWIEGKRPYADIEPLTADTDTTTAPLHLVLAYTKMELASLLAKRYPTDSRWGALTKEAELKVEQETKARPDIPLQPIRKNVPGRI